MTAGGERTPSAAGAAELNARALDRARKREAREQLALAAPALLVIGFALFIPLAWLLFQSFRGPSGFTAEHYLEVVRRPAYFGFLLRTFQLSILSTLICVLLAYPICYAMVTLPRAFASMLFACVIASFFASILVRTYAWLLLLQRKGVINSFLLERGWIEQPLELVYNLQGTLVGMVNILLPLMILPLYNAMQSVDRQMVRAALGLGATPTRAFVDVFLPLSRPGLVGGAILVFVASLGYYLTPAMLGGGRIVVWATAVASAAEENPVWGAASALGIILFVITFSMLFGLKRLFGASDLLKRRAA